MGESRRAVLHGLAFGAGALATTRAGAAVDDGHAAGADVAGSADFVRTIPRKGGDAAPFTASLDGGKIKATSGGWARDITTNGLPVATGIAGAHLFLNPGGIREMHWHASAEWGFILAGRCQVSILDPAGELEVVNFAPGDTWYFPAGHAHAIQTLGTSPCHAILAFDDGLYGDHGTFGLTDWMSRFERATLTTALGASTAVLDAMPAGETYIMQGPVVPLDSAAALGESVLDPARTHRHPLAAGPPRTRTPGGTMHVASAAEFPVSTGMTGFRTVLEPGAIHSPHWHAGANEWAYVVRGRARMTLFAPDKRMATAELKPGDCAYLPRACGHSVETLGSEPCELIGIFDSGTYSESSLSQWLARAPRHTLAANLGVPALAATDFPGTPIVIASRA